MTRHDGLMADRDKSNDIDRLLAEVENTLGGRPANQPAARKATPAEPSSGGLTARMRTAAIAGAVASVVVWFLFAMLPFLGATSGAAGAFLGTFFAVLVLRRR
jgi:uncharacterized membrane protein